MCSVTHSLMESDPISEQDLCLKMLYINHFIDFNYFYIGNEFRYGLIIKHPT